MEDDECVSEGLTMGVVSEGVDGTKRVSGELAAGSTVEDECEGKGVLTVPKGHWRSLSSVSESSNT